MIQLRAIQFAAQAGNERVVQEYFPQSSYEDNRRHTFVGSSSPAAANAIGVVIRPTARRPAPNVAGSLPYSRQSRAHSRRTKSMDRERVDRHP